MNQIHDEIYFELEEVRSAETVERLKAMLVTAAIEGEQKIIILDTLPVRAALDELGFNGPIETGQITQFLGWTHPNTEMLVFLWSDVMFGYMRKEIVEV